MPYAVIKSGGKQYRVQEGDTISINGFNGEVYLGEVPLMDAKYEEQDALIKLLGWADEIRTLGVRTNADYPVDAQRAVAFGAEGIGLCRTEHMFFEEERLPIVQRMITASTPTERAEAIAAGVEPYFEIPHAEMYGEPFDIAQPDELVFVSWFEGGEVFRSGCCWRRGRGRGPIGTTGSTGAGDPGCGTRGRPWRRHRPVRHRWPARRRGPRSAPPGARSRGRSRGGRGRSR